MDSIRLAFKNLQEDLQTLNLELQAVVPEEEKRKVLLIFYETIIQPHPTVNGNVFLPDDIVKKILLHAATEDVHLILPILNLSINKIFRDDEPTYRMNHIVTITDVVAGTAKIGDSSCNIINIQAYDKYFRPKAIRMNVKMNESYFETYTFKNFIKQHSDIVEINDSHCVFENILEFHRNLGKRIKFLELDYLTATDDPSEIAYECRSKLGPVLFPEAFMRSPHRPCKLILANGAAEIFGYYIRPRFTSPDVFFQNLEENHVVIEIESSATKRKYLVYDNAGHTHSELLFDMRDETVTIQKF